MNMNSELDARVLAERETLASTTQRLMAERNLSYEDASPIAYEMHVNARHVREAAPMAVQLAEKATATATRREAEQANGNLVQVLCSTRTNDPLRPTRPTVGGVPAFDSLYEVIAALTCSGVPYLEANEAAGRLVLERKVHIRLAPEKVHAAMRDRAARQREHGEDHESRAQRVAAAAHAVEQLESDFAPFLLSEDRTCIDPRLGLESPPQTAQRLMHVTGRSYDDCAAASLLLHTAARPSREARR